MRKCLAFAVWAFAGMSLGLNVAEAQGGGGGGNTTTAAFSPASYSASAVLGESSVGSVSLINTGSAQLTIAGISLVGANPGDFALGGNCTGGLVIPRQTNNFCTLQITFTPTVAGVRTASVSATFVNAASLALPLSGTALVAAPVLSANTDPIDFGDAAVGVPPPSLASFATITVSNVGGRNLTLNSLGFGGANPGDFVFGRANRGFSNCVSGGVLTPLSTCYIGLNFAPTALGPRSATFNLSTNDPARPTVTIALSGNGIPAPTPPPPTTATTNLFPQVAVGGGYTTLFEFMNTGLDAVTGNLILTGDDGKPLIASLSTSGAAGLIGSSVPISIPPGGSQSVAAGSVNPGDPTVVGWARVESSGGSLLGVATFKLVNGTQLTYLVGVLSSEASSSASVPINDDHTVGRDTGYAVANTGSSNINVKMILVNPDGSVFQTISPPQLNPLTPGGHVARFLWQDIGPAFQFNGTMVMVEAAGQSFSAVALVTEQGLFSSIPVSPTKAPGIK